jgi:hypothetical protein
MRTAERMIESAEEFVRLRTSEDPAEYRRAAVEPAPEPVWLEVVERYPEMRSWVAHNKTVPPSVLERLAGDPDPQVRRVVARKRKLDPALMARLADDPDDGVRHGVVCNASCPAEILRHMVKDRWSTVAHAARSRLKTPGWGMVRNSASEVRSAEVRKSDGERHSGRTEGSVRPLMRSGAMRRRCLL